MKYKLDAFEYVLNTMDKLRAECPWDKKQTMESLRMFTLEEAYELSDAVLNKSPQEIKEELGDLLLHIVFYSKIAEEKGDFSITDVCNCLVAKLMNRHPHIYGDVEVKDDEDVKNNWEQIKQKEGKKSALSGVPVELPSLVKAIRIQEKAKGVGFDWENKEQVWEKIQEEFSEFKEEIQKEHKDPKRIDHEFGDILFAMINYARFIHVNPDDALEHTNKRFVNRFTEMEKQVKKDNKTFRNMTIDEMEVYWQEAKRMMNYE